MLLLYRILLMSMVFCGWWGRLNGQSIQNSPFTSLNLYRLTNEEGLSQVSVNVLFKDSEGFLWIGTDDGLNRFDGKDVVHYFNRFDDPNTLAASEVYAICEDRKGRLWFAHYNNGISILDKASNKFSRLALDPKVLNRNRVYGLFCDSRGDIMVRTVNGISRINPNTLQVDHYDYPALEDETITAHVTILELGGDYWFGSRSKGLLRMDRNGRLASTEGWDSVLYGKSVASLCALEQNKLLAVTEKGLFMVRAGGPTLQVVPVVTNPVLFASATKVMRYGNTPYVWVATEAQGFFIVDLGARKVVRHLQSELVKDNLLSNSISYLLQDSERNVFIGTARGVNIYAPSNNLFNNYENIFRKIPGFGHPVYGIYELADGNLLLGTKRGGAYHFNTSTLTLDTILVQGAAEPRRRIITYRFEPLSSTQFLVCTGKGIFELNTLSTPLTMRRPKRFPELAALSHLEITDIHFQDDSTAWIASFDEGIFRWHRKRRALQQIREYAVHPKRGPVNDQIQKLVPTRDGRLILCTQFGFSILDPHTGLFQNFLPGNKYPYQLPGRNIKYAFDDGEAYWITTFGEGVQRYDKKRKTFRAYTTREGLPNDAVYSIIPDDAGRFWIGTNNGLAVLNPRTGAVKTYTTQDGLPDNEFNGHAAYRSASGKIFYSTLNGIVSVSPNQESRNPYQPPLVLTQLVAGSGKQDSVYNTYGKKFFAIPAGFNSLDLKFAALSFAAPLKNRYRVKLQGYDQNWLNLGNTNEIHYSNLSPGTYVFRMTATNNSGTWTTKELQISIRVLPFWYQTLFFKMALSFAIAALCFWFVQLYYRNRLRRQRQEYEKMLAVQDERQRISAEIHDDIGAGLLAVRLLAEITGRKIPDREVQQEVSKIHASIGELTGKMREVIWSLNVDNDNLENLLYYIQRQAYSLFENSSINLKVLFPTQEIPDIMISGEKRRHIYLAVKEALHNCLKHSGATHCNLTMNIVGNALHITITDDGKGFNNATQNSLGNGMPGMRKRMQQVNGQFIIRTKEKTEILFIIPLINKA